MTNSELACVYAVLLLADDNVAPTSEKIATILKAANIEVEPYWPELFAKALENIDIKQLITRVGSGIGSGGSAPAVATPEAAAAVTDEPAKKEDKKEESDESDDDLGLGLFD